MLVTSCGLLVRTSVSFEATGNLISAVFCSVVSPKFCLFSAESLTTLSCNNCAWVDDVTDVKLSVADDVWLPHADDVWLPVTDDVWLSDVNDVWLWHSDDVRCPDADELSMFNTRSASSASSSTSGCCSFLAVCAVRGL